MVDKPVLRADAARNRDAILQAARAVFAERGYLAPLSEVAAAAGVGRATLQRRFPTREALILALVHQNLDRLERLAAELGDADDGLVTLLTSTAWTIADGTGFIDFLYRPEAPRDARRQVAARLVTIAKPALERGQDAGLIRADLSANDLVIIADMLAGSIGHRSPVDTDLATLTRRTLSLVLDAIRPAPDHNAPR